MAGYCSAKFTRWTPADLSNTTFNHISKKGSKEAGISDPARYDIRLRQ